MCAQVSLSTMTEPLFMCVATTLWFKNLASKMEGTTLLKTASIGFQVLKAQKVSLRSLSVLASGFLQFVKSQNKLFAQSMTPTQKILLKNKRGAWHHLISKPQNSSPVPSPTLGKMMWCKIFWQRWLVTLTMALRFGCSKKKGLWLTLKLGSI